MRRLFAFFAATLVFFACRTLNVPEGPGTAYPCGVWGVECIEGTCCPYKHQCGGHRGYFTTCPEGYCCYEGDDWPRATPEGGVSMPPMIPMTRPGK